MNFMQKGLLVACERKMTKAEAAGENLHSGAMSRHTNQGVTKCESPNQATQ